MKAKRQLAWWVARRVMKSYQPHVRMPHVRMPNLRLRRPVAAAPRSMGAWAGLGMGAAVGAALMYALDPHHGRERRAAVGQGVRQAAQATGHAAGTAWRGVSGATGNAWRGVSGLTVDTFGRLRSRFERQHEPLNTTEMASE